ncbi:MAG: DNA-deoxyinosine glycosylase [Kiritimatiellae bacterium]|nr:DNA-deoxyinosine glycosylase [Kiritimatiellia bacterium]
MAGGRPRVLVLGSMPGPASLAAGEYYAHARNAFWRVMARVTGVPADAPYRERCAGLVRAGIALWDVVAECRRAGSADHEIRHDSVRLQDVAGWLCRHASVHTVMFNGEFAARMFRRHVQPRLGARGRALRLMQLPSTSPAHASRSEAQKTAIWLAAMRRAGVAPVARAC